MQAGKPVFKTVFYFFVISVALFALDGFSHTVLDKMSCSHSTHMIERKEPSTDQRSLSGRSKLSDIRYQIFIQFLYMFFASLQARHHLLFRIWTSHTCITLYTYVILAQGKKCVHQHCV